MKEAHKEALFSSEMQERYPFIQALLYSKDSEFLADPKNFENMALDDSETREFILYLQQVQPHLKLPEALLDGYHALTATLGTKEGEEIPSPHSTIGPESPLSPFKKVQANVVAITLEDAKTKQDSDGNDDKGGMFFTERAQEGTEETDGKEKSEDQEYGETGDKDLAS